MSAAEHEQYEYDINGNAIRQPSLIYMDRADVASVMCTSEDALRKADARKMWKVSEKYPRPHRLAKGKVLYLRKDVAQAIAARGLNKQIDVPNSLDLPPRVGLDYLAQLACLSRQQLSKNLKRNGFSAALLTEKSRGKAKKMSRKNVIRFLFGSSSSSSSKTQQPEKLSLAKVINLAQKRREKMIDQAKNICEQLNGRWNGNRGMCKCPAHHDDHSHSLSVTVNDDGDKVLVHCAMGCSQRDVIDALASLNLWPHRRRRRTRNRANSSLPVRSRSANQPYKQKQRQRRYSESDYAFGLIRDLEIEAEIELIAIERAEQAWSEIEDAYYFDLWVDKAWDEQLAFMDLAA